MEQIFGFNWSHILEHINPIFYSFGLVKIHWYGLMYGVAFLTVYLLVIYRLRTENFKYSGDTIFTAMLYAILGVLIGGRLGYVISSDFRYYLANPLKIISPFDFSNGLKYTGISRMAYHGGLIAVLSIDIIFCYQKKINIWHFTDLFVPAIPLGYTFGRLSNFINGELYGRVTTLPRGMYFPLDHTHQLRQPSQLYEAVFEGIFLFLIFWSIRKRKYFDGFFLSLYLIGYGLVRFFIEFVREPVPYATFRLVGPFNLAQIFCLGMVLGGIFIILIKKPTKQPNPQ